MSGYPARFQMVRHPVFKYISLRVLRQNFIVDADQIRVMQGDCLSMFTSFLCATIVHFVKFRCMETEWPIRILTYNKFVKYLLNEHLLIIRFLFS